MTESPTSTSLEDRLGYRFAEPERLVHALTHRSWCAENPGGASNERLEFLGDAVLGLIVTDHIFARFPDLSEGELAKTRASVVSATALGEVGADLGLGRDLRLGWGEDTSGGREKESILADAVEAILGAVYLDGGIEAAREFVLSWFADRIDDASIWPGEKDYKTRIQEIAAHDGYGSPEYYITTSGPDHHKRFRAVVVVGGKSLGAGDGSSKKEAEQRAACAACDACSAMVGATDV